MTIVSERSLGNGTKEVTVRLPMPEFKQREPIMQRQVREAMRRLVFEAFTDEKNLFRRLLTIHHDEATVDLITYFFENEGPTAPDAEVFLVQILGEFAQHSPVDMWLHYLHTTDLDKAVESYACGSMQRGFLNMATRAGGKPVANKCPKMSDEDHGNLVDDFNYICEQLGIGYTADVPVLVYRSPKPTTCGGGEGE